MKITIEQVKEVLDTVYAEAGMSYDGADIELDDDQVIIKTHKKIGGVLRTNGVTTGARIGDGVTFHNLARIAMLRQSDFLVRAGRECQEDIAVAAGAQPEMLPSERIKPLGWWLT